MMLDSTHRVLAWYRMWQGGMWYILGFVSILVMGQPTVAVAIPFQDEKAPRVTLTVKDSTLGYVVRTIAAQAKLGIAFDRKNPVFSRRIDVDLQGVLLSEAFATVLKGTDLRVSRAPNGETLIIRPVKDSSTSLGETKNAVGRISGQVTDSVLKKGVAGATVTLVGTKWSTVSDARGMFQLSGVTHGSYRLNIRILGYTTKTMPIDINSVETWVVAPLATAATALAEVVTTATGQQRRVEVGNDITVIKADSVVRTMPVGNVSELLATRVPGLYAAPTSGEPGAPTRVRIRGASSINAGNDPIIIIDGVRAYGEQFRTDNPWTGLRPTSPLDQVDVNSIETIEVLKGPSAVATYGSDAANGVILITTKHGTDGPPNWNLSSSIGVSTMPGKWPANYYRWGHSTANPQLLLGCPLPAEAARTCQPDSLETYQILNDPETTVFGTGLLQQVSGDLRGGMRGLTYALSGTILKDAGLVKMSNADRHLLEASGKLVPFWQRRPQQYAAQSGTLNVGLPIGPMHNVLFTTSLHHGVSTGSPLRKAITISQSLLPPTGKDVTGVLEQIPNFRQRETATVLRSRNALTLRSNLHWRVNTEATLGVDVSWPTTRTFLATGDCFDAAACNDTGMLTETLGPTTVTSMDLRASRLVDWGRLISFRNTIGLNYARSTIGYVTLFATGFPLGVISPGFASDLRVDEKRTDRVTAGAYVETVVSLANRVYVPLSLRKDAGSALGSRVAPLFPKLSFSYVVSDELWFRAIPTLGRLSTLRLRVGYGQAGRQPEVSDRLRTYTRSVTVWDGVNTSYLLLSGIGNTRLKPERAKEFEGGFDTDFWDNRVALGVSWYKQYTPDLLVSGVLPLSVGGGGTQWSNLGNVKKTGFETTLGATVIDSRPVSWHLDLLLSRNNNIITKLDDPTAAIGVSGQRYIVGFPLNGYWAKVLRGYNDFDHDGIIAQDEVLMSDIPVYVGSPEPDAVLSVGQSVTIVKRFSVIARLKYDHDFTQWRKIRNDDPNFSRDRVTWDATVPLNEQAYALWSDLARLQTVSTLRFNELSLSYIIPHSVTRRVLRTRTLQVSMQGKNLGLWTNYRGKDPSVNGAVGTEQTYDDGVLPKPRVWQLKVSIN